MTTATMLRNQIAASPAQQDRTGPTSSKRRRCLALGDAITVASACLVMSIGHDRGQALTAAATCVAAAMVSLARSSQWNDRAHVTRGAELAAVGRAIVAMTATIGIADRALGVGLSGSRILIATSFATLGLVLWRSVFRMSTTVRRAAGRDEMPTVLVGTGPRALDFLQSLDIHPEAGVRVVGVVGSASDLRLGGRTELWLGDLAHAAAAVDAAAPARVVVATDAIDDEQWQLIISAAAAADRHVDLHVAAPGLAPAMVRTGAIAHQTVLHITTPCPQHVQRRIKRAIDIVTAATLLAVTAPLLAMVSIAVRATDGGPALFRQQRVGRHGTPFTMVKFRSMTVDAESSLTAAHIANERDGPLFSARRDPRVTRIGSFLRRTSLDELPQLVNVLRGDMSLVGPRPALAREVEHFPAALHARHQVRPGITGLWQSEARDNPAFEAYRRLDLLYVRNWSLGLDAVILLATLEHLLTRLVMTRSTAESPPTPADPVAIGAAA